MCGMLSSNRLKDFVVWRCPTTIVVLLTIVSHLAHALIADFKSRNPSDAEVIAMGKSAAKEFDELVTSPDWILLQEDVLTNVAVYGMDYKTADGETRQVFKAEYLNPHPPELFYREFQSRYDEMADWVPTIMVSKKIRTIDPRTAITYQLMVPDAPYPLAAREFLAVRRATPQLVNGKVTYTVAYKGINYTHHAIPDPENKAISRVTLYPSGVRFQRSPEDPSQTKVSWISNVDLNYSEIPSHVLGLFEQFNMIMICEKTQERVADEARKLLASHAKI